MNIESTIELVKPYAIRIGIALVIFSAGMAAAWLARLIAMRSLRNGKPGPMVARFVSQLAYAVLLALTVAAALGQLGVQTASIVAVIGAAGLTIGLALQNSLANIASGLIIVALKPFNVGDFIEGGGQSGTVLEVGLMATTLKTATGQKVVIPNSKLTDGSIINYSVHPTRRFDTTVSVAYSSDLAFVRETVRKVIESDSRILQEPKPVVLIDELADSGITVGIRVWIGSADYWDVRFSLLEKIKVAFDKAGIEIPFPQRVVKVIGGK